MEHPVEAFMWRAIELARSAHGLGDLAIGAIVVRHNKILGEGVTTILRDHDPTCHAEINAIRHAAQSLGTAFLDECYLYTTFEPCPMCTSAAIWAKIRGIVYGASHEDSTKTYAWRVLIPAVEVVRNGTPRIELFPHFLRSDCKKLLDGI